MYAANLWLAVAVIGLACARHQGFSANLYALPSDIFPRWAVGSVVGVGWTIRRAGRHADEPVCRQCAADAWQLYPQYSSSASVAYLFALLVVHLIVPRYAPVTGLTSQN